LRRKPGETHVPTRPVGPAVFCWHRAQLHCTCPQYQSLTRDQLKHLKEKAFTGYELVQGTARVCAAMNMMLHGIGSEKSVPVVVGDALAARPRRAL
jgi:hypothetical protein